MRSHADLRNLTAAFLSRACRQAAFGAGLALLLAHSAMAATLSYHVLGGSAASWQAVLSSIGLIAGTEQSAGVIVAPEGTAAADWATRVEQGTILIVEGASPLAEAFGFRTVGKRVMVQSVEDVRAPELHILWQHALDLPVFEIPKDAQVFARERWQGAPLMAGLRRGKGAVLWIAASPGPDGYDRFPYLPQALADLGLTPPFQSRNLWAFFDSSYRSRVDLDYFAKKWRAAGISALHVAAWHYWERDPQADEYLRHLIEACHRNAIQVYAWFELPHVSDKFWDQHPEWREKTALLQDAQLDWRKLMNLSNPEAFQAVAAGVRDLIGRFDWDGVNLAELYYESLEGYDDPARFTPMNGDVRAEFHRAAGFDPHDLFDPASPRYLARNTTGLKQFLDFRAELAARQQAQWIDQIDQARRSKPQLDLVLTHIDDRFDPSMREKLGANTSRVLPLLGQHDFTFLIEDPATIWNLGPQRYAQIAARYAGLTSHQDKLAIDINVVDRYQDVYPTKQQTGAELFQLVHRAALSFPRVALYFESSIARVDLALLPAAATTVQRVQQAGEKLVVESQRGTGVAWTGPALVDGRLWPAFSRSHGPGLVWLPAGVHSVEPAPANAVLPIRVLDFNGELKSARVLNSGVELTYKSSARAMAVVDPIPRSLEIDGIAVAPQCEGDVLLLPRGQHLVTLVR
jgi:Glycosyl hydrolase-like 10